VTAVSDTVTAISGVYSEDGTSSSSSTSWSQGGGSSPFKRVTYYGGSIPVLVSTAFVTAMTPPVSEVETMPPSNKDQCATTTTTGTTTSGGGGGSSSGKTTRHYPNNG
jgi:hypothetical protein